MIDRIRPRPTLPATGAALAATAAAAVLLVALSACSTSTTPGAAHAPGAASASGPAGASAASGADDADAARAEAATGWTDKPGWTARREMIVAANPFAAQAGAEILKAGGSAVDAAIAAQMVLTLVEPQSSGLGGGAFLLFSDGKTTEALDGLETAPAAANGRLFAGADGTSGESGARAVGVPGTLRMLETAYRAHGRLPWKRLFQPAIRLAEQGVPISPRLAALLAREPALRDDAAARALYYDRDGQPKAAGTLLRNPALAATLRQIAGGGAHAFYEGPIAREIVARVGKPAANPGLLTLQDLARYRARPRTPLCTDYRNWTVCGMPPPSSGGLVVAQLLGILDARPDWRKPATQQAVRTASGLEPTPLAAHLFSEAGRLAYADRARYVADPDFIAAPGGPGADWQRLVAPAYLAQRAQRIGETDTGRASAGLPDGASLAGAFGDDPAATEPAASQLSIVDRYGAAVSMSSELGRPFGAKRMVGGFLLNDGLDAFSHLPPNRGQPLANRVEGGKRPRSSLAPELVFERGTRRVALVLGAADGVDAAKTLVGVGDAGLTIQQAIALPYVGSRNGPTGLERGRVSDTLADALRRRGHDVRMVEVASGLAGLQRISVDGQSLWLGGADPRREGVAVGE
jgi:gamma-glutamyltranspeptidase / glutathione hydrolase